MRHAMVVLLVLLCSACLRLPDDGRVEVGPQPGVTALDEGFPYEPRPPQPGETPQEIVRHFLDAMTANPVTTSVAREFLGAGARDTWDPESRMITYADTSSPSGTSDVDVTLIDANHLDSRGTWLGPLPEGESRITLPMTIEDGEWRIERAPDAMIVSDSWFEERYRQVALYFFDPAGRILVPEPVFVPRGGQLSTALMRGLLRGVPDNLRGVSRSFFPPGLSLDLSVPVSAEGVAEVALKGDVASADPETLELMTVQIGWTLRQDPSVSRVRVTVGDTPITESGTGSDFPVAVGQVYDPAGVYASLDLFGLRKGRLVKASDGREERVPGPFGRQRYGLREVSLDLPAERVVGVTDDGTSLLQAPVDEGGPRDVSTIVSGAADLLHPAWDHAGRLWILDRAASGAVVSVLMNGRRRTVRMPGITGSDVVAFLVSRDGSRVAAALDRPGSDVVVLSRIQRVGSDVRARPSRTILSGVGEQLEVRDLAWRSPTEVSVLSALTEELSEVRTFSVDGSRAVQQGESAIELIRDDIVRLASSPVPESASWAVPADGTVFELDPTVDAGVPLFGIGALTYVG